jgi:CHAT domain-containing protein
MDAAADARSSAHARLERAERRLAQALPQARGLARGEVDLAVLRAALPPDTALVWLHDLQHAKPTDFANAAVDLDDPDTFAFVLPSGDRAGAASPLGPASGITEALADWQALLATPASSLELVRARGTRLATLAWAPIARALPAKRLFIVAEGPLLRLPWPALPDGDGYLVERDRQFHVLNHEHELLAPERARDMRHALLAVADPRGGTAAAAAPLRDCTDPTSLPPLPGARREVERLAALLGEEKGKASMLALVGEAASEARFRSEAPHSTVLHLATHGIEAGSGCVVAGTRGLSLRAESAPSTPAASTALLFAAPATTTGGSADDGLLGGLEIAALDLSGVQWAVLAACSTAAGSTHAYEGLYGLARAFRLAGARTVLLSLWPVDDDATAQWSEALYVSRLRGRMDTPSAMQQAQRAVLAARRAAGQSDHPWYWAGFIAVGDWR